MLKGIDVSYANGIVDFNKVKNTVDFIIIRVGYGKNNMDAQFLRNIQECNRLGIPLGVYWFSYALSAEEARMEAVYCLEAIKSYKVDYPIFFDLEYDSIAFAQKKGITIDPNAHALAFLKEIEKAGYKAGVYTNKDYADKVFNAEVLKYPTWLAFYGTNNATVPKDIPDINHVMLQYTSKGQLDGINGYVDINISYVDYAEQKEIKVDKWVQKNSRWWYQYADGTYPKEQWLELDNKWYYFDKDGWMLTGWLLYKESWYFLDLENGHMVVDLLLDLKGSKYYIKPDGKMAYTDSSGALI